VQKEVRGRVKGGGRKIGVAGGGRQKRKRMEIEFISHSTCGSTSPDQRKHIT